MLLCLELAWLTVLVRLTVLAWLAREASSWKAETYTHLMTWLYGACGKTNQLLGGSTSPKPKPDVFNSTF